MFTTPGPLSQQEPATQQPNYELLRSMGWNIDVSYGNYCVAWRDHDEVVFEWRQNTWHRVTGRANPVG
ncbi:MAG: hypothetical protein NZU63_07380 [Gemmataceae bacterium]|nr:hypothetical protein [Gemmataceae bacterium]MDW8242788.1 hypothetical protein [Thermogemmata sp.]